MSDQYSFCETPAAFLWHIRELSDAGPKPHGGADTPTLCGREAAWDIRCEITPASLQTVAEVGAGKRCPHCVKAYKDRSPVKVGQ
jgi:hypothetical protein